MDRAMERFSHVVKVRADFERPDADVPQAAGRPLADLYAEYHLSAHGVTAGAALLAAFAEIEEEVAGATA